MIACVQNIQIPIQSNAKLLYNAINFDPKENLAIGAYVKDTYILLIIRFIFKVLSSFYV